MMILVGGIIEFNLNLGFKFLKYLNQSDYFKINLVKLINLVMINLIFLILVLIERFNSLYQLQFLFG